MKLVSQTSESCNFKLYANKHYMHVARRSITQIKVTVDGMDENYRNSFYTFLPTTNAYSPCRMNEDNSYFMSSRELKVTHACEWRDERDGERT